MIDDAHRASVCDNAKDIRRDALEGFVLETLKDYSLHPDLVKELITALHAESRKLMAYVDGKLEAGDAREVEAFLETSEEARELVAKLRGSADLLKKTYAPVLSAPAPQHMVGANKGKSGRSNVVKLSRFSVPKSWTAMTTSVALGVIVGVGGMQGYYSSSDEDTPAQEPSFKTRGGSSSALEAVDLRHEFLKDLKIFLEGTEAGRRLKSPLRAGAWSFIRPAKSARAQQDLFAAP